MLSATTFVGLRPGPVVLKAPVASTAGSSSLGAPPGAVASPALAVAVSLFLASQARRRGRALRAQGSQGAPWDLLVQGGKKKVLIVGGGIGGLVSGGQLAKQGFDVTIFEKNDEVGGRCQSLTREGFRWDSGPSLLLLPQKYEQAFAKMGANLKDHITLRRVAPAYRVVFSDNSSLDLHYDMQLMADQLEEFEPGAKTNYCRFLSLARRMYEMGVARFIDRPFTTWQELLDLPELIPLLFERGWWNLPFLDIAGPYDVLLKKFFKDPRLRAIFSFQTMYVGLTPFKAPGAFSLLAGTELTDGVWYPLGGFQGVKTELEKIGLGLGVKIRSKTAVDQVIVEDGKAVGVRIGGEVVRGDVVLVNADLPWAYNNLLKGADAQLPLPPEHNAGAPRPSPVQDFGTYWSEKKKFSSGVISFLWAVDIEVPRLLHHTVFLGCPGEEDKAWEPICRATDVASAPNFYVHTPSKSDPSSAPKGKDSVMILFPVANMQEMQQAGIDVSKPGVYTEMAKACKEAVLRRFREAGCGDIEQHIVDETIRDPQEWKSLYNLDHGAAFGLSCGLLQLAMTRPAPRDENGIKSLYFVGASTRPGNGVPLVMMGAGLVADQIAKDMGMAPAPGESVSAWASKRPTACEP